MEQYKQNFIEFMIECNALRFGEFITKSGRKSPFFINTGLYKTGSQLRKLGQYYAKAIQENYGLDFDILFGPAYKGIPLSVATSIAINVLYNKEVGYCSNRKEIKDHGDTGILLGSPIKDNDKIIIIEDVTTSGASIRETLPILKSQGNLDILGLIISVDRMEKGQSDKSALLELEENYNIKTASIVNMKEVIDYLYNRKINDKIIIDDKIKSDIDDYYKIYGIN